MRKCVFFWIVLLGIVFAPAFLEGAARYYRYSDDKQLYYTRDGRIYRYSDDKQILYYRGEDFKLTVFMVLMLADM